MSYPKPDLRYWEEKTTAYLHDPPDKALDIRGHQERAAAVIEALGLQYTNEQYWKVADGVASGFERGQLPGYKEDKNAVVDFCSNPYLSHPTSKCNPMKINLPENLDHKRISSEIISILKNNDLVGMESNRFTNDPLTYAKARMLFIHLILRFKLANDDIGGLGGLWHRLPADTRFPDHSIWQHNALVSAIYSCMKIANNPEGTGLMVFSITPVQDFISRARKLRDYWVGSVLLSWLAFEGISWVMENLGPDHIIYPSLIDQPLVNEYLKLFFKDSRIDEKYGLTSQNDIASFPNKFLALIPMNYAKEIAAEIQDNISYNWIDLSSRVRDLLLTQIPDLSQEEQQQIEGMFKRQNSNLWKYDWCSSYLIDRDNIEEAKKMLPDKSLSKPVKILRTYMEMIKNKEHYEKSGKGSLYSVTHSLVQSGLANLKTQNVLIRDEEPGEKCQLCGEFEILHNILPRNMDKAQKYKECRTAFWENIRQSFNEGLDKKISYNINDNERLCSICLTKRLLHKAVLLNKEHHTRHILFNAFKSAERFPSTTEIALHSYFRREGLEDYQSRIKKADAIHNRSDDSRDSDNKDNYYAILMMDGDRMGDLINGLTFASSWETILHPQIYQAIKNGKFIEPYQSNWNKIIKDTLITTRSVSPSIHTTISEALGDFSVYSVPQIVSSRNGRLIYAGGDDVCAIVPLEEAIEIACLIREHYRHSYRLIKKVNNKISIINIDKDYWKPDTGKLSGGLGVGENISISGAVHITHHKESLTQSITECRNLLEQKAKNEGGRDALAIQLNKRSGNLRTIVRKWDFDWSLFAGIGKSMSLSEDNDIATASTSFAYRLESFYDAFQTMLNKDNWRELTTGFIYNQIKRSALNKKKTKDELNKLAGDIARACIVEHQDKVLSFDPQCLIIIGFLYKTASNTQ